MSCLYFNYSDVFDMVVFEGGLKGLGLGNNGGSGLGWWLMFEAR